MGNRTTTRGLGTCSTRFEPCSITFVQLGTASRDRWPSHVVGESKTEEGLCEKQELFDGAQIINALAVMKELFAQPVRRLHRLIDVIERKGIPGQNAAETVLERALPSIRVSRVKHRFQSCDAEDQ